MSSYKRRLPLLCAAALLCAFAFLVPRKASAIFPLSGTWSCSAYASCVFNVTTSNHPSYQWSFGDGTSSGVTTSTTTWHTYNIPYTTTPQNFTVYLTGYTTSGGGTIDNIVSCTVTTYRTSVGGDPTNFSGNCN